MWPLTDSSSPLSSPASGIQTPPSAWFGARASRAADGASRVAHESSSPGQQLTDTTATTAVSFQSPMKPDSSVSTSSNRGKKRALVEVEDQPSPTPKKKARRSPLPPAPPSNRPSRSRKAPERFEDIPQTPKKPAQQRKLPTSSKAFDPDYITTNPKSRLVKTDVYHLLLADDAWTCLTIDQKRTLFKMLPKSPDNIRLRQQIENAEVAETTRPKEFGKNFNLFRTDVAKFREDLENGYLTKTWQAHAEQAVIDRAEGKFDEWKAAEAEMWWGQKGGD